jgi:hypothetical protein
MARDRIGVREPFVTNCQLGTGTVWRGSYGHLRLDAGVLVWRLNDLCKQVMFGIRLGSEHPLPEFSRAKERAEALRDAIVHNRPEQTMNTQ